MRRAALLVPLLGIFFLAHPGSAVASSPRYDVSIDLDPASGEIVIEQRVEGVEDPLRFDPPRWLSVVEARLQDRPVPSPEDGFELSAAEVRGRTLFLRLSGTMPGPGPEEQAAMISAEGGYLFGDAGWLPEAADRALYDIAIRVPGDHRAIATGRLLSERIEDGAYEADFIYRGHAPSILVGPYEVAERMREGLRLRTYFHSEHRDLSDAYLAAAEGYIRRFGERIGAYPYQGFSIVSAPVGVGLGFDSLAYVARQILPHPYMRGRSLAHEVLHSWWGNAVAVDYQTGNWAEGLTTYMADYALAEDAGADAAREMRLEWLRNLSALPPGRDVPARAFRAKTHDAAQVVGYDKVALIFHMLRREIGDSAFDEGLRTFWQRHRFGEAGWSDLREAFEAAAGRELDWFFEQWLARPGLPRLSLEDARVEASANGHALELRLAQSAPPYRLRVPVAIETAAGTERIEVEMTGPSERVDLVLEEPPTAVRVDPAFDVARELLPGESAPILRDVTLAENAALVVASGGPGLEPTVSRLAARLLHREPAVLSAEDAADRAGPRLVIGGTDAVAALREGVLPGPVPRVAWDGAARAWAERGPAGAAWMFVSADDAADLGDPLVRLRYYGNRSFVVLDGGEVVSEGLWPAEDNPLMKTL